MTAEELGIQFIGLLYRLFPHMIAKPVPTRPNPRYSIVPKDSPNTKRWMQVEWTEELLKVDMDHCVGEITEDDVSKTGIACGRDGRRTGLIITRNDDAVSISVMSHDPVDFDRQEFIDFLYKHHASYLRRIGR